MTLDEHLAALRAQALATDGVTSLVTFGSASQGSAARRDEWSDVDFTVFLRPDAAERLGRSWEFLPAPERIVLRAREGGVGGVVVYDDGMLYEFAAGLPWEVRDSERQVLIDGGDIVVADPPALPSAADQVGLFLVKLYIGVGRVRRGERVAGNAHIRCYALGALCEALRQRLAPDAPRSPFDPLRRLETALPEVGARLGALLDRELEECARGLYDLSRRVLEPGWADFPSAGADLVAGRLGWPSSEVLGRLADGQA